MDSEDIDNDLDEDEDLFEGFESRGHRPVTQ